MNISSSRFLLFCTLVLALSACSQTDGSSGPVAVILSIELSPDALLVDGTPVSNDQLISIVEKEAKSHQTFASLNIDGNTPMELVNGLMHSLRNSKIAGVHYTSESGKQEFYQIAI